MNRMPPVPESAAGPADPVVANDYDSFAEAYSAENEANLINAYYERPAILALAGDVAGRRILDAGCGSGPLFAALRDRGAIMTGFDKSTGMLELARRTADHVCRPSLCRSHHAPRGLARVRGAGHVRGQARLLQNLQAHRGVDHGRPHCPNELLGPAAARDDRRIYRGRLPDSGRQRASARAGRPRAVPDEIAASPRFLCFLFFVLQAG
jgi:hypothetical protein